MKSMTRILSLALAVILALSLCAVGAFADDAPPSAEPEGETTRSATPAPEAGTPTPAETAAPTATLAPTPTAAPSPVPTAAPTETPAPTEAPEIGPPNEDGPNIDEPCGDGIEMGPNNPPKDGPMMFAANSNSATIAVRSCYDSSNNSIKYANSFQYDGRWVGGATYPRHIIYANNSPAYCLEPGKYLVGGSNVTTDAAKIWAGYSTTKKDAIKLAILCGAEGNASNLSGSYGSQYTATQMIVWEFVVGVRSTSSPYSVSDNKVINSVCYNGANSEVIPLIFFPLNRIPKRVPICKFRRRVWREHDLRVDDAAFLRIGFPFSIVFRKQALAALICGPGDGGLAPAALGDRELKVRTRYRQNLLQRWGRQRSWRRGRRLPLFLCGGARAAPSPFGERKRPGTGV